MKKRILVLIIILAVILSAFATYKITKSSLLSSSISKSHGHGEESEEKEGHGKGEKPEIKGLKTAKAMKGEGYNTIIVSGKVVVPPDRFVKISPRIAGKIITAKGFIGQTVKKGETLAVISSVELAEARAEYRKSLAAFRAAQKNYEQEMQILSLGSNSKRQYEEARVEALESQSNLATTKSDLAKAKSELTQCKARLARARELYRDQIVSKQDLESAEAEFSKDSATLAQAESSYEQARTKAEISRQYLQREEKLYQGKVLDIKAIQSAKSSLASAEIEFQAAADKIRVLGADPEGTGDTIDIRSPINGRITSRNTNIGEMATPENVLFTVADVSEVWVEADIYEKDISRVKRGEPLEVKVESYPDIVFKGKVEAVGDILNSESRTAKIRCTIDNSRQLLKGEMFATISLITDKKGEAILIPKQAVLDDSGHKIVFVPCMECKEDKESGKSVCGSFDKIEVKTASEHDNLIEISEGIEPGTEVVTEGQFQLKAALSSGKLEAGCSH